MERQIRIRPARRRVRRASSLKPRQRAGFVSVCLFFLLHLFTVPRHADAWTYDPRGPSSRDYWGLISTTCSPLLVPWQSPVELGMSDLYAPSSSASARLSRPSHSALITSVVDSRDPEGLTTISMKLERLPSGLLMARPTVAHEADGRNFRQGLTIRISIAEGGAVDIQEMQREATEEGASGDTADFYQLEAVMIHTGSEHAARLWGAVCELQFILNPLNASQGIRGIAPRTTVISVPLVLSTSEGEGSRLQSPARSFVSQILREINSLAASATTSSAVATATTRSASNVNAAPARATGYDDGSGNSGSDAKSADSSATSSTVDIGVSGLGLSGSRQFFANVVPFLPVPIQTKSLPHDENCEIKHNVANPSANPCATVDVSLLPTSTYMYEGTLTFPPCLPILPDRSGSSHSNASYLDTLRDAYHPNASVQFLPSLIGDGDSPILISIPTVRHIVTPPCTVSQQTINNIALLTGRRSTPVSLSSTSTPSPGSSLVDLITTTYTIPITTSRTPQSRNGRKIQKVRTLLPLYQDVGAGGENDRKQRLNLGLPHTVRLGVDSSSPSSTSIQIDGVATIPQSVYEHHVILMRKNEWNVRMRTVTIVLSFLCAVVAVYVFVLLLVRWDRLTIPTSLGGKRIHVDFWTNPRSVLPSFVDPLDEDASSASPCSSDGDGSGYMIHSKGRMSRLANSSSPFRSLHQQRSFTEKKNNRVWVQDDDDNSSADDRMLIGLQHMYGKHRSNEGNASISFSNSRIGRGSHGQRSETPSPNSPARVMVMPGGGQHGRPPALKGDAHSRGKKRNASPHSMRNPLIAPNATGGRTAASSQHKLAFDLKPTMMNKSPRLASQVPIETNNTARLSEEVPNAASAPNPLLPMSKQKR